MTNNREKNFHFARVEATSEGKWKNCLYAACRKYRRCKGGPRGTFSRDGEPVCARPFSCLPPYLRPSDGIDWFNPDGIPPEIGKSVDRKEEG